MVLEVFCYKFWKYR